MDSFNKAETNEEILDSFQKITILLNNHLLKFTGIDKKKLINIAKIKKEKENINWISIKSKFGNLLKLLNYKEKEQLLWDKFDINKCTQGYLYNIKSDYLIKSKNSLSNIYVKKFSINSDSIMLLTDTSKVFVKGHNVFYKFGSESNKYIEKFTELKNIPENCIDIVNGYSFAFYIYNDKILASGCGEDGRTGTGNLKVNNFDKVKIDEEVVQVTSSSVSTCFLTKLGDLYTCGSAIYNGQNKDENILIPKKLNIDTKFKFIKISSGEGGYHFGALNENGDVFVWGHNRVGQLGINPRGMKEVKRELRVLDNDDHEIVLTKPYKLNLNKRVFDIKFSWGHSCLFFSNNDISLFGRNCCNQLGINKEHCIIDDKSHEYFYKQNILDTCMKIDNVKLLKFSTLLLSNNVIYYYGTLNRLKGSIDDNDFELKKLKDLSSFDVISIIDNNYILIK